MRNGIAVRSSGQSINARLNPAGIQNGKDIRQLQGWYEAAGDAQLGYTVPNLRKVVQAVKAVTYR